MSTMTEAEVFQNDVNCPMWQKYKCYKVACTMMNKKAQPAAVWAIANVLLLCDKGLLNGTERKQAEESLNALGWETFTNTKGLLALRPKV
jgi:hypothetical protein